MAIRWDHIRRMKARMSSLYELGNRPIQDSSVKVFWANGVPMNVNVQSGTRYGQESRKMAR